jgi:hypothetical protein
MNEGLPNQAPRPANQEEPEKSLEHPSNVENAETAIQPEVQEAPINASQQQDKVPSAEDFRNNFDRLKEREDVEPEQRMKDYRRLGREIQDRRGELERTAKEEQTQLQQARIKLGLSEAAEDTHSGRATAQEMKELDTLYRDVEDEFREGRKSLETIEREKTIKLRRVLDT